MRWQKENWLDLRKLAFTVIPVKPWTLEKLSGMFIVLRPIRCEMKPKDYCQTAQGLVITWHKTIGWLFLPWQIHDKSSTLLFSNTRTQYCSFSISAYMYVQENNRYKQYQIKQAVSDTVKKHVWEYKNWVRLSISLWYIQHCELYW